MKPLALIALIIILAQFGSAELVVNQYTNDFALTSPNNDQLKLCSCETKTDMLLVENVGNFESTYTVHVTYPNKADIAESEFTLPPGHAKDVLIYLEDTCGLTGVFDYNVRVENDYGRVRELSRTVRIDTCESAKLQVSPEHIDSGLCTPIVFDVTTTNVGRFADTYTLSFGQHDDKVEAIRDMWLRPGESKTQNVTFEFPCTEHGEKTLGFSLKTEKTGADEYVERAISISNEYDFSLGIGTEISVCAQQSTHAPIIVENAISVPDEITLQITGPAFVTFDDQTRERTITVDPNDNETVKLEIRSDVIGDHAISIAATDTYGGIQKTRDLTLHVEDCFSSAVEIAEDTATACCGLERYDAHITNLADTEQTFQLSVDGPAFFTLDERTVKLQPGQKTTVPLRADLPCAGDTYTATVTSHPVGKDDIVSSDSITIESLTTRACHMIQIDNDEFVLHANNGQVIPVVVQSTGLRGGTYNVTDDSEFFSFQEAQFSIEAGDDVELHLVSEIDATEEGRYVVNPSFTLDGVTYNEFLGVELTGKTVRPDLMQALYASVCGLSGCGKLALVLIAILLVLILILILIYIGMIRLFRRGLRRRILWILKTPIVLVIIALVIALVFLPTPGRDVTHERLAETSGTELEWYQDEQHMVNLDQFFDDPDDDILVYEAEQPDDVSLSIVDNTLTLTPDIGFSGENIVVITASDDKGGVIDSPEFTLRVIGKKNLGLIGRLGMWCTHVIALLWIAILIVLFLMVLTIRERRQDLRSQNVLVVVPKKATTARAAKRVRFYASKNGKSAHTRGCMAMKRVKTRDRITYKSKTSVLNAGLNLCSMCTKAKVRKTVVKRTRKKASTRKRSKKAVKKSKRTRKPARKSTRKRTKALAKRPVKKVRAVPVRKSVRKKGAKKKDQTVNIQVNIGQK